MSLILTSQSKSGKSSKKDKRGGAFMLVINIILIISLDKVNRMLIRPLMFFFDCLFHIMRLCNMKIKNGWRILRTNFDLASYNHLQSFLESSDIIEKTRLSTSFQKRMISFQPESS